MIDGELKKYKRGMSMEENTPWAKHVKHPLGVPLLGAYVGDYMNRADVRSALNIPPSVQGWS